MDSPGTGSGGGRRRRAEPGPDPEQHSAPRPPASPTGEVRGGHPEPDEEQPAPPALGPLRPPADARTARPGPRPAHLRAFDTAPTGSSSGSGSVEGKAQQAEGAGPPGGREPAGRRTGLLVLSTVVAAVAAAVLVAVVTGRVTGGHHTGAAGPGREGRARAVIDPAAANAGPAPAPPPTYEQLMSRRFPLSATLRAAGTFMTVPGNAPAPGSGRLYRYRVDIERGLGLDGTLFAEAVQRTLNDDRSWAHHGEKRFERVSSGDADFVITLASPGTTARWCARSGLDTLEENVSCDSADTNRVMINAYRWAQGAATYGPHAMYAYRQMLINHEVGHRLGHDHENCVTPGAPAPVMQQQTKSLDLDGIACKANPWVYPKG